MRIAIRPVFGTDPLVGFLLRGSMVALLTRAAGVLLSYAAAVLLSRTLGAAGYGAYSIGLALALLLVLPSRAGFDNAALKFAAIYIGSSRLSHLRGFLKFAAMTIVSFSCVTGLIVYLAARFGVTSTRSDTVFAAALLIFPLAALGFVAAVMRAARHIFASQFYEQVFRPALFIALVLVALVAHVKLSPASALMLTAASAFVALAISVVHLRCALPNSASRADYSAWREWISLSGPLLLAAIIQEALNQVDILMLGILADTRSAGLFSAAWRLASLVSFAVAALTSVSGPLIASLYDQRDWTRLARMAVAAAQIGTVAALAASLPLVFAGRLVLSLFGPEFVSAYPALLVLLLGGVANALTGSVAYLMTMTGRHVPATMIFAGALFLSIFLNLLLIPRFGTVGAAVASSSATAAWNLAMLAYVRRTIGIDASALALQRRPVERK